jgi:hypothetical protein
MKTITACLAGALCALALPATAMANDHKTPKSPQQAATWACKKERAGDQAAFKARSESKTPMRDCKRSKRNGIVEELRAARKSCAAEGKKGRALGRCKAAKENQTLRAFVQSHRNAAWTCKRWRDGHAPEGENRTFSGAWGEKSNAFGKCVSKTAKQQREEGNGEETLTA